MPVGFVPRGAVGIVALAVVVGIVALAVELALAASGGAKLPGLCSGRP